MKRFRFPVAGVRHIFLFRSVGSAGEAKYTEPIPEKADEKELDLVQVLYLPR